MPDTDRLYIGSDPTPAPDPSSESALALPPAPVPLEEANELPLVENKPGRPLSEELKTLSQAARYGIAYYRHSSQTNEFSIRVKPRRSAPMPKNRGSEKKVK